MCRRALFVISIAILFPMLIVAHDAPMLSESNAESIACGITDDEAQQGAFSVGYSAIFETQANGTSVDVQFELLDTDKEGVVGILWQQSPFTEFNMTAQGDNVFTITMDGLTSGETVNYACKFAFAGGLAVTKYFTYTVGDACQVDPLKDATLSDIQIDGESLPNFDPDQLTYTYETSTVPTVTATTTEEGAIPQVTPAEEVPGTATILVTSEDGSTTLTYAIDFTVPLNYVLVWSDEFDEAGPIDAEKWFHQTQIPQGTSWFNDEGQHYTNRLDNSIVEDGVLKIIAKKEVGYTQAGVSKDYTSARLNSKYAFTYGKVDVRAKLPAELGTWPAIWTLGKNISENGAYWQTQGFGTTTWPITGEIDIMEQFGRSTGEKNEIHGSTHTPRSSGATENTSKTTVNTSTTEFHVYSIIWDEEKIQFVVDDETYYTYDPSSRYGVLNTNKGSGEMNWPFFEPQYLILNVAMGGVLGGTIPSNFTESTMEIDYVRVYQLQESSLSAEPINAELSEASENGTVVASVTADYVGDGTLAYAITAGNGAGIFQINEQTGEITVVDNTNLSFANSTSYTLTVSITDGVLSETIAVNITVIQVEVLSLSDDLEGKVMAYPNPVDSILELSFAASFSAAVERVTDVAGKEVDVRIEEMGNVVNIDFSGQAEGVYLIQLATPEGSQIVRVRKGS